MKSWLMLLLRLALGILFLVSGFAKLTGLGSFVRTLESLNFLPVELIPFLSLAIPSVEIVLGILLSGGILLHYATRATLGLLIIFSIVILTQIISGNTTSCNCFGALFRGETDVSALLRNLLLSGISFLVIKYKSDLFSLEKLIKDLKGEKTLRQLLINHWLEISAAVSALALFVLSIGLLVPTALGTNRSAAPANQQRASEAELFRAQFTSVTEIKDRLRQAHPDADSIVVVVLDKKLGQNIEGYDIYLEQQRMARYVGILSSGGTRCKVCPDLHYLIKVSEQQKIQDIQFLSALDEATTHKLADLFKGASLLQPVRSHEAFESLHDNAYWRYYFVQGLKKAGNALKNFEAF
jgi:uncharacterized membrane protein YphA (DoxX/SURF4 family)